MQKEYNKDKSSLAILRLLPDWLLGLPGVRFGPDSSVFGDLSGQKYDAKPDN